MKFFIGDTRGKEMKNARDSYTTIRSNKIDRGRSKIKDTERRNGLPLEEKTI